MNISEANALNRVLGHLLRIPVDVALVEGVPVDVIPAEVLNSAVFLAERAAGVLGAGLSGEQVRQALGQQHALRAQQKAAVVAALESGRYFACDGEAIAALPSCEPCEGTGKRFPWAALPDCPDCGGLGKVYAQDGPK